MHLILNILLSLSLILLLDKAPVVSSTYVPGGRCQCLKVMNQTPVRPLDFSITEKNTHCQTVEILVKLPRYDRMLCLSPSSRQGKRLLKCWRRVNRTGKNKRRCLRTTKKGKPSQKGQNQKKTKGIA